MASNIKYQYAFMSNSHGILYPTLLHVVTKLIVDIKSDI